MWSAQLQLLQSRTELCINTNRFDHSWKDTPKYILLQYTHNNKILQYAAILYTLKRFRTLAMIVLLGIGRWYLYMFAFSLSFFHTHTYTLHIVIILYALQRCHEGRKQININRSSKQIK